MTEKELQKLKRVDLLEILVEQGKEIERLQKELDETKEKLEDRRLHIDSMGSIAEASLAMNGVFEAAQSAAAQYVENIRYRSEQQEKICQEMEQQTKEKCHAMIEAAEKEIEERWDDVSTRLEKFYDAHEGLRELLDMLGGARPNLRKSNNN